jgi:hypothetical protein
VWAAALESVVGFGAGVGDVCVGVEDTQHFLRNVLLVPELFSNLMSVRRMGELRFSIAFTHQDCTLFRHGALDHVRTCCQ